jgi:hypothetical protein
MARTLNRLPFWALFWQLSGPQVTWVDPGTDLKNLKKQVTPPIFSVQGPCHGVVHGVDTRPILKSKAVKSRWGACTGEGKGVGWGTNWNRQMLGAPRRVGGGVYTGNGKGSGKSKRARGDWELEVHVS